MLQPCRRQGTFSLDIDTFYPPADGSAPGLGTTAAGARVPLDALDLFPHEPFGRVDHRPPHRFVREARDHTLDDLLDFIFAEPRRRQQAEDRLADGFPLLRCQECGEGVGEMWLARRREIRRELRIPAGEGICGWRTLGRRLVQLRDRSAEILSGRRRRGGGRRAAGGRRADVCERRIQPVEAS